MASVGRPEAAGDHWARLALERASEAVTQQTRQRHERLIRLFLEFTESRQQLRPDVAMTAMAEQKRHVLGWAPSTTATNLGLLHGAIARVLNHPLTSTKHERDYHTALAAEARLEWKHKAAPLQLEQLNAMPENVRGPMQAAFVLCARIGNLNGVEFLRYDTRTHAWTVIWRDHKTIATLGQQQLTITVTSEFTAARSWLSAQERERTRNETAWRQQQQQRQPQRQRQQRTRRVENPPGRRAFDDATITAISRALAKDGWGRHSVRRGGAQFRVARGETIPQVRTLTLHTTDRALIEYLDEIRR